MVANEAYNVNLASTSVYRSRAATSSLFPGAESCLWTSWVLCSVYGIYLILQCFTSGYACCPVDILIKVEFVIVNGFVSTCQGRLRSTRVPLLGDPLEISRILKSGPEEPQAVYGMFGVVIITISSYFIM